MPDGKGNGERRTGTRLARRYLSSRIQLLWAGQRWRGGAPLLIGQHVATGCYGSKLVHLSIVPLACPLFLASLLRSLVPHLLSLVWVLAGPIPLGSLPTADPPGLSCRGLGVSLRVEAPRAYPPGCGLGVVGLGQAQGCVGTCGLVGGAGVAGIPAWGSEVLGFHCSCSLEASHSRESVESHSRFTSARASKSCVEWGSKVSSLVPMVTMGRGP